MATSTSSSRSSVRPSSSKQPWGTVLKPDFGLGHQRLPEDQIDQAVQRLHTTSTQASSSSSSSSSRGGLQSLLQAAAITTRVKKMSQDDIDAMLERLTKVQREKIPDSDRRLQSSIYKDMEVVSSYAWQGYNY
ncbi:hypothetical protein ACOMHN_031618 [Nucella lapillus]